METVGTYEEYLASVRAQEARDKDRFRGWDSHDDPSQPWTVRIQRILPLIEERPFQIRVMGAIDNMLNVVT